jgi:BirA family biotin operon repressor/biotin-[acetyl-CoA-carboxylase] ligase
MPFIELVSTDSTNNYALERVHAGLTRDGEAIFAHEQVAGKGQRGRTWLSEKGSNLILSVVINPAPLKASDQFKLSATVAVAVYDFFSAYAGDDVKIKWPNDIYWQDRKAGGILIESVISGLSPANADDLSDSGTSWKWAVAGIGININQGSFPEFLNRAVSLRQITGKTYSTVSLAKQLNGMLQEKIQELRTIGFDNIYRQYLQHLYKKDQVVKLRQDNRLFQGLIKSVSPYGELIVESGIEELFTVGQIEWVIQ